MCYLKFGSWWQRQTVLSVGNAIKEEKFEECICYLNEYLFYLNIISNKSSEETNMNSVGYLQSLASKTS